MDNQLRMRMETERIDHAKQRFAGMEPAMIDW
jgi:hypothetical protein